MLKRLVLASASPRRRELLELLNIPFEVVPSEIDETPRTGETPVDFAMRVAGEKGEGVALKAPDAMVLSADTIVSVDGRILGKPADAADAARMLALLSGRQHLVHTAVSLLDAPSGLRSGGVDETRVWFRDLDRSAIQDYLRRENVLDKAGAYGIQGFASVFIPRIEGNYANVVGLPLSLTADLLRRHGLTCAIS